MFRYLVKRILIFIPTLLVISLLTFLLSKAAPGDPVTDKLPPLDEFDGGQKEYKRIYTKLAQEMGFDRPAFYLGWSAVANPDTLHRLIFPPEREPLLRLVNQYGNWEQISAYYYSIYAVIDTIEQIQDTLTADTRIQAKRAINNLFFQYEDARINKAFSDARLAINASPVLAKQLMPVVDQLNSRYDQMREQASPMLCWIPRLSWHGINNQYHHWISNFILGDFGKSYSDGRAVSFKIKNAIWWTLIINVISILLIFLLAVPIGVAAARKQGQRFDRYTTLILFILYSLPSFWIATLLVVFFTTPEYGMKLFESIGLGDLPASAPFGDRFMEKTRHLILPIFCNSFNSLAFVSRQMRGGILDVLGQDYIRTARAKGLKERQVMWKHALRNALSPMITLFALILPASIGGSVVIEVIFNIPGMGRLIFNSIFANDWPIVFTVMMLGAVLTLIGNLLADILYAYTDPRVKFN